MATITHKCFWKNVNALKKKKKVTKHIIDHLEILSDDFDEK